jgi:hypothetical protein
MLQRRNKPRPGRFLITLLLITLLQMLVQQASATAFIVAGGTTHTCEHVESRELPDSMAAGTTQSPSSCCETPDCHNPACQNLCALGHAVTAPGFFSSPLRAGSDIYHVLTVVFFSDALANPPFHPPRA